MRRSVALFIAALAAAILVPPAEARRLHGGFTTSAPAGAVGLVPGVQIDPIIAAGDVVGDFQQTGVPDGMGWWRSSKRTVEVLMNHDVAGTAATSALCRSIGGAVRTQRGSGG